MNCREKLPVILILLFLIAACKKDDNKPCTAGAAPLSNTAVYPLIVGNKWLYYKEMYFDDSLIHQGYCTKFISHVQTLPDSSITFAMDFRDSTAANNFYTGTQFFNAGSTGLYHYGYIFGSTGGVYLMQEPQ